MVIRNRRNSRNSRNRGVQPRYRRIRRRYSEGARFQRLPLLYSGYTTRVETLGGAKVCAGPRSVRRPRHARLHKLQSLATACSPGGKFGTWPAWRQKARVWSLHHRVETKETKGTKVE